ncbi:hypothetical protein HMPREF0971_03266 [Segatella oris F0302]|uniref:Uncharacterized protein n=1 Tax=Segatella oris F0302 TaxID=649760 RepID=D1QW71_9BACT|nr:hypothetical protein HMPREF0971_03266 [Segatella oris F0302]
MTDEKRQGAGCRKIFRQICFLPHFCVSVILLRCGFQQDNFLDFPFSMFLLFLEAVVKAALFVAEEVRAIQAVINLHRLSQTPSTYLTKPQEKYTPAHRNKSERQTSYLPSSVFVFFGGFYTSASLHIPSLI